MHPLQQQIETLAATPAGTPLPADAETVVGALIDALERGEIRAAERGGDGTWRAVPWVKRGILLGFRAGAVVDMSPPSGPFRFFDKHTFPTQALTLESGVRMVPGGSTVRRGAFLSPGVVCMPPMYVNVGAWVGAGTMIDSHALVGSCAQIGARVHLQRGCPGRRRARARQRRAGGDRGRRVRRRQLRRSTRAPWCASAWCWRRA